MLSRAFALCSLFVAGALSTAGSAAQAAPALATAPAVALATVSQAMISGATGSDPTVPDSTINEFIPQDRPIGDCISALPKPGCGSEARGGWHQYMVLIAVVAGLAVIGWRIVAGVRRAPPDRDLTRSG